MLKHYLLVVNSPVPPYRMCSDVRTRETNNYYHVCQDLKMSHPQQNVLHRACKHVRPVARLWHVPELVFIQASAKGTLVH